MCPSKIAFISNNLVCHDWITSPSMEVNSSGLESFVKISYKMFGDGWDIYWWLLFQPNFDDKKKWKTVYQNMKKYVLVFFIA